MSAGSRTVTTDGRNLLSNGDMEAAGTDTGLCSRTQLHHQETQPSSKARRSLRRAKSVPVKQEEGGCKISKAAKRRKASASKADGIANAPVELFSTDRTESCQSPLRPGPHECRLVTTALASLHPDIVSRNSQRRLTMLESCGLRTSVTDAVVSTMLSQNTTDANSKSAFASLKRAFPSWESVAMCDELEIIESAIRVAGLAKTRAERIRSLLRTVQEERGKPSLEYLRMMSDVQVKQELSRFKGLGPKTISCVLLFALGRAEFPVDTHVLRISKKLGWVSATETREGAYQRLNAAVPEDVKLDLHCLMVAHGKRCHRCAANGRPQFPPEDGSKLKCPLADQASRSKKCKEATDSIKASELRSSVKKEEEHMSACAKLHRITKGESDEIVVKKEEND